MTGGGKVATAGLTANQALAAFLQLGDARRPVPAALRDALAAVVAESEPRAHILLQHVVLLLPDIDVWRPASLTVQVDCLHLISCIGQRLLPRVGDDVGPCRARSLTSRCGRCCVARSVPSCPTSPTRS